MLGGESVQPAIHLRVAIIAEEPDGDDEPKHDVGRAFSTTSCLQLAIGNLCPHKVNTDRFFKQAIRSRRTNLSCFNWDFVSRSVIAASLLGDVFEHHDPRRKAAFFEY